ncbi:MAG: hypothetical protein WAV72_13605 [Bradyrhizobium sp.]
MLAQLGTIPAAVGAVVSRRFGIRFRNWAALAVTASLLAGCMPRPIPLAGADPADAGAKVAGVGYRSTIAPYTSLRPIAPSPWREQNDRAAPVPKTKE